jgi:signal transduction histidine kinase
MNPWLAIDAATPPAPRARELRREWERFLSGDDLGAVRGPVVDSWRRSIGFGVDPCGSEMAPVAADRLEAADRWAEHPLREAAGLIRHCLRSIAEESGHLIVVSDAAGMLLQLEGDAGVRSRAADSMNFTEGALWSERGAGTNAIGTALAADHAVQIFAAEHFNEVVHPWTCAAAPIHDPLSGELLGVIDLTGLERTVHPHSLAVATTTARAVEAFLRERHRPGLNGWSRARQRPAGAPRRRDEMHALADEQAALRRLAVAVAHDEPPAEVFRAIADEIGPLLGADDASVVRFEADGTTATVLAGTGCWANRPPSELRVDLEHAPAVGAVFRTGAAVRLDRRDYERVAGPVAEYLRRYGIRSAVASPIVVECRRWGAMVATTRSTPLSRDTERRMAQFAALVGIVIANAESRAELTASRARVLAAADEARRRIQRDLHDGAQQRLVGTVLALKLARQEMGDPDGPAGRLLDEALAQAQGATQELRELAHGILPAALARGGLRAGIEALVARLHLPVSVDVTPQRLPAPLEATAYFIVAEALTNTVKHARATQGSVTAVFDRGALALEVRDDGVGGASIDGSRGLLGLRDRAAALDGDLRVESPPGRGTLIAATLPVPPSDAGRRTGEPLTFAPPPAGVAQSVRAAES